MSLLPLIFIWSNHCRYTLLRQLRTPGQRFRSAASGTRRRNGAGALSACWIYSKKVERATGIDLPSYGGVVANSSICLQTGYLR